MFNIYLGWLVFNGVLVKNPSIMFRQSVSNSIGAAFTAVVENTVVANSTCISVKPAISPSNVAQNANPGTVLDSARPEDSKTPPTC